VASDRPQVHLRLVHVITALFVAGVGLFALANALGLSKPGLNRGTQAPSRLFLGGTTKTLPSGAAGAVTPAPPTGFTDNSGVRIGGGSGGSGLAPGGRILAPAPGGSTGTNGGDSSTPVLPETSLPALLPLSAALVCAGYAAKRHWGGRRGPTP
jgi:hypothetical protein